MEILFVCKPIYISDDGQKFETMEECVRHEFGKDAVNDIHIFSQVTNEWTEEKLSKEAYGICSFIVVNSFQAAKALRKIAYEWGEECPFDDPLPAIEDYTNADYPLAFAYDNGWIPWREEKKIMMKEISDMEALITRAAPPPPHRD